MIIKTLRIACDLFDAAGRMRTQLGEERFFKELHPRLMRIRENLAAGPNPDVGIVVVELLEWGFYTEIQPILDVIIAGHGFDWRLVTGRRRRFAALASGPAISMEVLGLWERALEKATTFLAGC
ncbi:MAG: hypothetical protein G8237_08790 [Magnetococcales bacterium]|nr:hypothetical protein [Magnetococcales bacterium]